MIYGYSNKLLSIILTLCSFIRIIVLGYMLGTMFLHVLSHTKSGKYGSHFTRWAFDPIQKWLHSHQIHAIVVSVGILYRASHYFSLHNSKLNDIDGYFSL